MLLGLRGPVRAFADAGHIAVDSQANNQKIFNERFVILKGERMRWGNLDSVEHTLVPDAPSLPEFETTGPLAPGEERSFVMMTTGSTRIHCTEHPQMIGTLVVRER